MNAIEVSDRVENAKRKLKLDWYSSEIPKRMEYLGSILRELEADPLKPYLLTHNTVNEYLAELCMTLRRIQQITAGAEVKEEMKEAMPEAAHRIDTMKERAVREIVTTPPEKRMDVLRSAVSTPGKMTAAKIKLAKARIIAPTLDADTHAPVAAAAPCCPTCRRPLP